MKRFYIQIFVLALLTIFSTSLVVAEKKDKELPKSGSLASAYGGGYESRTVDGPWGGLESAGGSASPITGSISKLSGTEWMMRVFNNSENRYSVSLEVAQFNKRGTKVKADHFSYTLSPNEKAERKVRASASTANCVVNLKSWKNLDANKK